MTSTDRPPAPHSWLDAGPVRRDSDIALGCILLLSGAVAILLAPATSLASWNRLGAGFFPTVIGGLLLAVGIILLVRGSVFGGGRPARWSARSLMIVAAAIVTVGVAAWGWGLEL